MSAEWVRSETADCPGEPTLDRAGVVLAHFAYLDARDAGKAPVDSVEAGIRAYLHAVAHPLPISLNHQREVIR